MDWKQPSKELPENGEQVLAAFRRHDGWRYERLTFMRLSGVGVSWYREDDVYRIPDYWCRLIAPPTRERGGGG